MGVRPMKGFLSPSPGAGYACVKPGDSRRDGRWQSGGAGGFGLRRREKWGLPVGHIHTLLIKQERVCKSRGDQEGHLAQGVCQE